jgi:phosphomannomutase
MEDKINSFKDFKTGDKFGKYTITKIADFQKGYKDYPKDNLIFIHLDDDHHFAIRPSGTEPLLRIYFDSVDGDQKDLEDLVKAQLDR